MSTPEFLTEEQMRASFQGGPDPKNAVLAILAGRMYRHERDGWRLLDDRPHSTVREFTGAAADVS